MSPCSLGVGGFTSEEGGAIVERGGVDIAGTLARRVGEDGAGRLGVVSRRARPVLEEPLVGGEALL